MSRSRGGLPPRPPDDQLRRPRRRVRSLSRGTRKIDVAFGTSKLEQAENVPTESELFCCSKSEVLFRMFDTV
jgi:hypothetical protein